MLSAPGCSGRADVTGLDLSPAMVDQARQRCDSAARLMVADLADDLPLEPRSFDGVTCSLALHYLRDWQVPLASFARILRPGGWVVISLDHPFGAPLPDQRGGYFQQQLVSGTWNKADVEVTQHFGDVHSARWPMRSPTRACSSSGSQSRVRRLRRYGGFPPSCAVSSTRPASSSIDCVTGVLRRRSRRCRKRTSPLPRCASP